MEKQGLTPPTLDLNTNGIPDKWEGEFSREMLALGAPQAYWGDNIWSALQSGNLNPSATLEEGGMTIQEIYNARPPDDLHDVFIQAERSTFNFYVTDTITDDGSPPSGGGYYAYGSGFGSGSIECWDRSARTEHALDVTLDPLSVSPETSPAWFNTKSQNAPWTYHTDWHHISEPNPSTLFAIDEMGTSSITYMLTDGGNTSFNQFQKTRDGDCSTTIETNWGGETRQSKFRLFRPRPTNYPLDLFFLKVTTKYALVDSSVPDFPNSYITVDRSSAAPVTSVEKIKVTIPAYGHTSPWIETTPAAALNIERSVNLNPVEVAVDADRDGEITFDGKDKTTAERPFRFWINNDQDDVEADEPSAVTYPDSNKCSIDTMRDLEDYCRLSLRTGIPITDLQNGNWQIGLRFTNVTSPTTPSIHVFANQSEVGNTDYLTDGTSAANQLALSNHCFQTYNGMIVIPKMYWLRRSDSTAHVIFDGITEGSGNLSVVILDENGNEIGETLGPWIKLLDVRKMYQRARIKNEANQIDDPWVNDTPPAQTWDKDPWLWPYDEDPSADPIAAVFVHGWKMTYLDYLQWSQTSYKRLWHQGFKGKFYSFRWATYSKDTVIPYTELFTYNPSEYRAWLCGPALADFVNQLPDPPEKRNIFGHSMGNVTTGSALRSGMNVKNYAMCNAAMAAMAYDPDPVLRLRTDGSGAPLSDIFYYTAPNRTPDTDPVSAIRETYGLQNKLYTPNIPHKPVMFNFGLPNDYALGIWSWNNLHFKPDDAGHSYYYQEIPQPPNLSYKLFHAPPNAAPREVTRLPEAMGFVTKSMTRTAGSELRTKGSIGDFQNMDDWSNVGGNHGGFGSQHNAEWAWNYQSSNLFWKKLTEVLKLKN